MRALIIVFLASRLLCSGDEIDGGVVTVKGQKLLAEVARTQVERERALAYRTVFKSERCMFVLPEEDGQHPVRTLKFLLPFDVVWIDTQGNIVELLEHVPPCEDLQNCPEHGGMKSSRYYLFLAAGTVRKLKLRTGDHLQWDLHFSDGSTLRNGPRIPNGSRPKTSKKKVSSVGKRS